MSQPAQLRVILADHDVRKVLLPSGIPEIPDAFSVVRAFRLHYKDVDSGDEFFTLPSPTDLMDKGTIKVVFVQHQEPDSPTKLNCVTNVTQQRCEEHDADGATSVSADDTLILSSSEDSPGHRAQRWPAQFVIPTFTSVTEMQIQSANEAMGLFSLPKVSSHYSQTVLEN